MGKGGGGTDTVNTVTNSGPPPQILAQYENLIGQSNQVAQTPYTTGGFNASNMLAGFSPDQTSAFNTVDQSQGIQNPYLAAGQADLNASQTPLWNGVQQYSPSTMAQYANPYLNQAVGSTEAQIQNTNAQQQNQVMGNAISAGAWGGDRSAIAQSELANQQALAENQTISGMENTGFNQQQGEFNTQQQAQLGANEANAWLGSQGAALESGLGTTAQTTALNGATAQYNMGTAQQQQNQSALNIPYEQFQAQQAYPFQTLQYNADISEGLGSSSGGTGTGSTTSPAPNEFSQDVGTAAGLGTLGYLGYLGYGALGLSDKRLKENIKKIGTMKGNNGFYPIYTYNFKGDNETRMGVIAQDVEKRNPGAVGESNGFKTVHYGKLARGGFIPHRASGGFTPQHFDLGGGTGGATPGYLPPSSFGDTVPSVGPININPQSMPHGAGPPNVKAPMPYVPPANNGLQNAITGMGAIAAAQRGANGSSGLAEQAGADFDVANAQNAGLGDMLGGAGWSGGQPLVNAAGDSVGAGASDASAGILSQAENWISGLFSKGGFVPKHYDGGGGIGLPTAQQTGASPGVANVANQLQNMTVEQLQQLNARSGGRNPQIQMALQRKQMTGGAAQQPQQAGTAPMAAQAQGAAPPAQAAAVPSGAQPENIMQQNGFARGGFAPQHFDLGGSDDTPIPDPNGDIASGLGGSPQLQGMNPMQYAALANINRSAPPIASPASSTQGITPQNSSGTPPLPSHDDFMKNYNATVMNAAPYNKPDPILSLLSTMGAIGAGRSSKFGVNAGQGAVEGIQNWAGANKEAAAESEKRGSLQEQGEGIYQKMVDARNDMNLKNQELAERTTNDAAMRKLQQEQIEKSKYMPAQGFIKDPTTGQLIPTALSFDTSKGTYLNDPNTILSGKGGAGASPNMMMDFSATDPTIKDLSKKVEDISPEKTYGLYYGAMGALKRNPQINQFTQQQPGIINTLTPEAAGGVPTEDLKTLQNSSQAMQSDLMKQMKNIRTQREFNTVTGQGQVIGGDQQNGYNNATVMAAGTLSAKVEPTFKSELMNKTGMNAKDADIVWNQYLQDNDPVIRDTKGNVKPKINENGQITGLNESVFSPASWQSYMNPQVAKSIKDGSYQAPKKVFIPADATWSVKNNGWVVPHNGGYALWQP